jgi:hypothetical protein
VEWENYDRFTLTIETVKFYTQANKSQVLNVKQNRILNVKYNTILNVEQNTILNVKKHNLNVI